MLSLSLVSFKPINNETHVVAVIIGLLIFAGFYLAMPNTDAFTSLCHSVVVGCCWYVFKFFDGMSYDGAESMAGTLFGLGLTVILASLYFL